MLQPAAQRIPPRLIPAGGVPPQPWRNGGGVTRELLARPQPQHWRLRISVAEVASAGPFSSYPGVQRWFAVLEGAGVELTIDGAAQSVTAGDAPVSFDGAAATHCRLLDGPTRDLNLMLRNTAGSMRRVEHASAWQPRSAMCGLFTAVAGTCQYEGLPVAAPVRIELPAHALLWFEPAPAALVFRADPPATRAIGWWIAATPGQCLR